MKLIKTCFLVDMAQDMHICISCLSHPTVRDNPGQTRERIYDVISNNVATRIAIIRWNIKVKCDPPTHSVLFGFCYVLIDSIKRLLALPS